jgi:hypothetical protein
MMRREGQPRGQAARTKIPPEGGKRAVENHGQDARATTIRAEARTSNNQAGRMPAPHQYELKLALQTIRQAGCLRYLNIPPEGGIPNLIIGQYQ